MGCDIHPGIEVRQTDCPFWTFVAVPDRGRNYEFFGRIAGVRGRAAEPLAPGRGIPADTQVPETVLCGGHSGSYFTLAEARQFSPGRGSEGMQQQWARWFKTMEFFRNLYGVAASDVRVVFDFDS